MQQALARVKAGEWNFADIEEEFQRVMNISLDENSTLQLPGRRAFNCLIEAAGVLAERGDWLSWMNARHVSQPSHRC